MIPAILATIYIMFLYWKLKTPLEPKNAPSDVSVTALQQELDQLNSKIATLEKKLKAKA